MVSETKYLGNKFNFCYTATLKTRKHFLEQLKEYMHIHTHANVHTHTPHSWVRRLNIVSNFVSN